MNQAPIPSHYLISCSEAYTVAPTTINPILRRKVATLGFFVWGGRASDCREVTGTHMFLSAAVSYYFACEHADETFRFYEVAAQ